jgi:O-antigen/teichoic acid export membrane protein
VPNDDGAAAPLGGDPGPPRSAEPTLAGLAGEVSWTYVAAGASAVTNVALLGFSLRRLSVAEFGTYAVLSTFALLLNAFDFALSTTAVRAAATAATTRDHDERSSSLETIRAVHACNVGLAVGVLASTIAGCTIAALAHAPRLAVLIGLLGLATSLGTGTAVLLGVATGARRFRQLALATIAGLMVSTLVTVLLIGRFGVAILGAAELGRVVASRGVIGRWVRPLGRLALPSRPSLGSLRAIARPVWSLLAISVSGLAISSTDVLLLGAMSGSAAAGAYRIGSLLPAQATGLLFRGYDAAFPLLAGERDPALQTQVTRLLTRLFSVAAAAGLGAVALHADLVVRALSGTSEALSRRALIAFCIVWSVNVVIHGPALHLLSRGGQALLARVVLAELAVNVLLTITLVIVLGPIGAAVASLVAVTASNLVVAPAVMRRALGAEVGRTVWYTGLAALLAGAGSAAAGRLAGAMLAGPAASVVVTLVVTGACAAAAMALLSTRDERRLLAGSLQRRHARPPPRSETC